MDSSRRLTRISTSAGPSCSSAPWMAGRTSSGLSAVSPSIRDAAQADAWARRRPDGAAEPQRREQLGGNRHRSCFLPRAFDPTTRRTAMRIDSKKIGAALLAATVLTLGACATLHQREAQSTEQVLAAAGFKAKPADTPERIANLNTMPPRKLV